MVEFSSSETPVDWIYWTTKVNGKNQQTSIIWFDLIVTRWIQINGILLNNSLSILEQLYPVYSIITIGLWILVYLWKIERYKNVQNIQSYIKYEINPYLDSIFLIISLKVYSKHSHSG